MLLYQATEGSTYTVVSVQTGDEALQAHLFSLGLFSGQPITLIRRTKRGCTVSIKDGRYHIDDALSAAIAVEPA